jgi:glucosyl-dolichyl phosphate glucuronosyltransferase
VSVVAPTYRRAHTLQLLLEGLAVQQDAPTWELVIVDNDDAGLADEVVARHPVDAPTRVLHEPRSGATHARNHGIAAARGDIIAMVDDDVVPAPDWLARLTAPIRDGRADATGGRVVLDPTVERPGWFDEDIVGQYLTNFDLGHDERELGPDGFVVTASAAFRTDLLRQVGGFDTRLGPRGTTQLVSDDVQLCRAVMGAGGRLRWVPDAVVVHELPESRLQRSWLLKRAYLQGRSDWQVDEDTLRSRRANGARVATSWLSGQVRRRMAEGVQRPDVAFHLACDVARTAGRLREAAAWGVDKVRR